MVTGVVHCSVELPIDTVKSRFQAGSGSYADTFKELFARGGPAGARELFRGYLPWICRAPLVHGVSFTVMATLKPYLDAW